MTRNVFPCILFLSALLTMQCYSQNDVGFQVFSVPDSAEVFCVSAPERIPILRSDMPWEVRSAYIVLDTICKTYTYDQLKEIIDGMSNDSLEIGFKALVNMVNYDPFLYEHQYRYIAHFPPPGYKSNWLDVISLLNGAYIDRIYTKPILSENLDDIRSLVQWNACVYRVRVIYNDMRADSNSFASLPYKGCTTNRYWADATIQTKYKGMHHPSLCSPDIEGQLDNNCIRYTWESYSIGSTCSGWNKEDVRDGSYLAPGNEYLVFHFYANRGDYNYWCYTYQATATERLLIQNGIVHDPKNLFGTGGQLSLEEAETIIIDILNELEL